MDGEETKERGKRRKTKTGGGLGIPERVRERAQHVFPLSRSFRTAECSHSNAGVTFVVTATLVSYARSPRPSGSDGGSGEARADLFRSSIILFYFPRDSLSRRLPFDLSLSTRRRRFIFIYDPTGTRARWDSPSLPPFHRVVYPTSLP